jgi:hypothetical protein
MHNITNGNKLAVMQAETQYIRIVDIDNMLMKAIYIKVLPIVICFITIGKTAFAQKETVVYNIGQKGLTINENANTYIRDTVINDFVGHWHWQKKDSLLSFIFTKITKNVGSDSIRIDIDFISGGYILTVKGKQVINTLASNPLLGNSEGRPGSLLFSLFNSQKKTHTRLLFKKKGTSQIIFRLEERVGEVFFKSDKDFLLPTNIVLTKGR